jgi:hypothetical protein
MSYFYTKESMCGSSTSHGFANDTVVKVWESKRTRDKYLDTGKNLSACAIKRKQVIEHATNYSLSTNQDRKPNTLRGEYWGIERPMDYDEHPEAYPSGYVGIIEIGNKNFEIERFSK